MVDVMTRYLLLTISKKPVHETALWYDKNKHPLIEQKILKTCVFHSSIALLLSYEVVPNSKKVLFPLITLSFQSLLDMYIVGQALREKSILVLPHQPLVVPKDIVLFRYMSAMTYM